MKRYKGIIFDLDGTMLDTEEMNIVPLQKLIKEELGQTIEYNDLLKYRAFTGIKTLEILGFKNIEGSYKKWVRYVNEHEGGAKLYPKFKEVIEAIHSNGVLCGIASSKMRKQYEIDFLKTDLEKYMDAVVLAEDTENHKPHPEPLFKAAEILGISPSEAIYIGDTYFDFVASKEAGMDFGLALWGAYSTEGIEADYVFNDTNDILNLLEK